nr:MAG TPA: hypothetical protein [Caudoviricetes sp.]
MQIDRTGPPGSGRIQRRLPGGKVIHLTGGRSDSGPPRAILLSYHPAPICATRTFVLPRFPRGFRQKPHPRAGH